MTVLNRFFNGNNPFIVLSALEIEDADTALTVEHGFTSFHGEPTVPSLVLIQAHRAVTITPGEEEEPDIITEAYPQFTYDNVTHTTIDIYCDTAGATFDLVLA